MRPPNAPELSVRLPRILVDFDGVVHDHHKLQWPALGEPIPGAFQWLASLFPHYEVCIFSARALQVGNVLQMKRWFRLWWPNDLPDIEVGQGELRFLFTAEKLPAMLCVDDRAVRFTGKFPAAETLLNYQTWQDGVKTENVAEHAGELRSWAGHLRTSSESFANLADKPCFCDAWKARFLTIADQIQEAATSIETALPPT